VTNLANRQANLKQMRNRGSSETRFRDAVNTHTQIWGEILHRALRICNFFTKLYERLPNFEATLLVPRRASSNFGVVTRHTGDLLIW
jgi:hypothetical protein